MLVTMAAPRTTATANPATIRTSRQPGCPPTRRGSATVRLAGDADRGDQDLAGVCRATTRLQSGLGTVERDREIGRYRRVGRLAAGQVHRRRGVDGDDRDAGRPGAPDDLDGRADRLAE